MPIHPLLLDTDRSLVRQSLAAREGAEPVNGDGFGLGWYAEGQEEPGLYRNVAPAWNDDNLADLARHISSHAFIAHVRAATGTPVQESNCHPFRWNGRLFAHNGAIAGFEHIRRDLMLAIDPSLFSEIQGSTDSELMFYLSLTLGAADDPLGGIERMVGFVETACAQHGIGGALQMTCALLDGERLVTARYATAAVPRTLYYSTRTSELHQMYPDHPAIQRLPVGARGIVSEPTGDTPGVWNTVEPGTFAIVEDGEIELRPLTVRRDTAVAMLR